MLWLYRLSAQNAPSAQVNVSPQLWMNSFCGWVLHATTCRNTAAFYYNSVLIIYNVMYMTVRVIVINIIVVCPARDACWRENLRTNEALLLQRNSTKCISYEINNSRPISTIYKAAKMFWNNLYRTWSTLRVFHSACANLSLFKDWNPCRHAPLSVTDYEKWNLNL